MKLGSIGSSLVRYFRRPATSVPPKIEPTHHVMTLPAGTVVTQELIDEVKRKGISDLILKQLRDTAHPQAERAGIKPPLDAGTNGWTWSQWSKEVAGAGTIPGWAFCRFANRLGPENVGFVFGHVRGGFGVWRQPFDVCTGHDEGVEQRSEILTCVTHLNSGMGVGIFVDRDTAVLAAELAERVCPTWQGDAPLNIWHENMIRTRTAWDAIGICQSISAHAHDQHGTRFPIYGQDNESVMAGKPERFS